MTMKLINGEALEELKKMESNTIDTVLTDPPYGLSKHSEKIIRETMSKWLSGEEDYIPNGSGFMGKGWDSFVPPPALWKEVLRVMKPGGTALVFAGTRTQDLMTMSMRLAGFEIKDVVMWLYGSGFPKAQDIGKMIDKRKDWKNIEKIQEIIKEARMKTGKTLKRIGEECGEKYWNRGGYMFFETGMTLPTKEQWLKLKKCLNLPDDYDGVFEEAEREIVGKRKAGLGTGKTFAILQSEGENKNAPSEIPVTTPATPEAKLWDGYKTHSLKPAYEPIILAIKPNDGTYAQNALKWGVAGLNIDAGRIPHKNKEDYEESVQKNRHGDIRVPIKGIYHGDYRPPENYNGSKGRYPANIIMDGEAAKMLDEQSGIVSQGHWAKTKVSGFGKFGGGKTEYSGVGEKDMSKRGASRFFYVAKASRKERGNGNNHPTVKPIKLIEYLVGLTSTPSNEQIYLDPFMGSGTTGIAVKKAGKHFIGIEMDSHYFEIAQRRIGEIKNVKKIEEWFE